MSHLQPLNHALTDTKQDELPAAQALRTPFTRMRVEVVSGYQDARGCVFEPLAATEIAQYRNVHIVLSEPGAVRGNHCHVRGCEITTVPGPMLVRVRESDGGSQQLRDFEVPDGAIWRFSFPPGVAHAFKNTGTRVSVLASFNTEVHDPDHQDVVREVLIES